MDALLHVSQISRAHVDKPSDVLSVGQEITAKVVDLNVAEKKISLSMKAVAYRHYRTGRSADMLGYRIYQIPFGFYFDNGLR